MTITFLMILIGFLLLGGVFSFFYFKKKIRELKQVTKPEQGILMLQNQIGEIRKSIHSQSGQNVKIVQEVAEKLGKLDKTNQKIVDFGSQLQDLQNILQNPKHRGILGESCLEMVLKNILPPDVYQMQYNLGKEDKENGKGLIVDAVIFIKERLIPVDAKFSLENYSRLIKEKDPSRKEQLEKIFQQDLKKRIEETSKYVRPEKNTLEFAFMFIPSEAIYYDLLVGKVGAIKSEASSLVEYALRDKKVIIVSPTTFLAYLQMVVQGLNALQIEDSAREIKKNVAGLIKHIKATDVFLQRLGRNLSATVTNFNNLGRELRKIDKDVLKITGEQAQVEKNLLEKPELDN
ncbi:MAG TPA: DNA recombination protein RmuC [Candidatus Nanoarchaeia archaeon]|nr:DNA recombination protein RmuC [Candidatus Nanoarchaeia archaeon]